MTRTIATVISNSNRNGTVRLSTTDGKIGVGKTSDRLRKGDKVVANVTLPYPRRIYHFSNLEKVIE